MFYNDNVILPLPKTWPPLYIQIANIRHDDFPGTSLAPSHEYNLDCHVAKQLRDNKIIPHVNQT